MNERADVMKQDMAAAYYECCGMNVIRKHIKKIEAVVWTMGIIQRLMTTAMKRQH